QCFSGKIASRANSPFAIFSDDDDPVNFPVRDQILIPFVVTDRAVSRQSLVNLLHYIHKGSVFLIQFPVQGKLARENKIVKSFCCLLNRRGQLSLLSVK